MSGPSTSKHQQRPNSAHSAHNGEDKTQNPASDDYALNSIVTSEAIPPGRIMGGFRDQSVRSLRLTDRAATGKHFAFFDTLSTRKLLNGRYIVLIGDSVMRSQYKDVVHMVNNATSLVYPNDMGKKGELRYEHDQLVSGFRLTGKEGTNGIDYEEVRIFLPRFDDCKALLGYCFVTRIWNRNIERTLKEEYFNPANKHGAPDIIYINSCLWDLARYGPYRTSEKMFREYQQNFEKLLDEFKKMSSNKSWLVFQSTLPVAKHCNGAFIADKNEVTEEMWKHVQKANKMCAEVVKARQKDGQLVVFLDTYAMAKNLQLEFLMENDGTHWRPQAHRLFSYCMLAVAQKLLSPLPLPENSPNRYFEACDEMYRYYEYVKWLLYRRAKCTGRTLEEISKYEDQEETLRGRKNDFEDFGGQRRGDAEGKFGIFRIRNEQEPEGKQSRKRKRRPMPASSQSDLVYAATCSPSMTSAFPYIHPASPLDTMSKQPYPASAECAVGVSYGNGSMQASPHQNGFAAMAPPYHNNIYGTLPPGSPHLLTDRSAPSTTEYHTNLCDSTNQSPRYSHADFNSITYASSSSLKRDASGRKDLLSGMLHCEPASSPGSPGSVTDRSKPSLPVPHPMLVTPQIYVHQRMETSYQSSASCVTLLETPVVRNSLPVISMASVSSWSTATSLASSRPPLPKGSMRPPPPPPPTRPSSTGHSTLPTPRLSEIPQRLMSVTSPNGMNWPDAHSSSDEYLTHGAGTVQYGSPSHIDPYAMTNGYNGQEDHSNGSPRIGDVDMAYDPRTAHARPQ